MFSSGSASSTAWRRGRSMSRERLRQSRQNLRQSKSQPRLWTVQDELSELRSILRHRSQSGRKRQAPQVSQGPPPSLPPPTDYYGRVVAVQPADAIHRLEVELDCLADGEIFTETISCTEARPLPSFYRKLKVGDVVQCRQYPGWEAARQDGHNKAFVVSKVFSKTEKKKLLCQGVVFPDVPPDLR